MPASRDLKVTLIGEDNTRRAFKSAESNAAGFGSKIKGIGGGLALAFGGGAIAAVAGVGAALVAGVRDAASYQQITDQVGQTIKSTGGAARVTVEDLKAYAGQLEAQSGIDEELILNGQNVLLTFTKVRNEVGKGNDVFNQASQAALDLSTTMGGDLAGANVLVGKALNDPIKGITALTRAGVQLTAEQKAQIKTMVASGDTMGAQKIILGELTTQFGGAAEAAGKGLTGSLARAKDAFSDIMREVGERVIPVLADVADWAAVKLPPAFDAIKSAIVPVVEFFKSTVVPFFEKGMAAVSEAFGKGATDTGGSMSKVSETIRKMVEFARTTFESFKQIVTSVVTIVRALWDAFGANMVRSLTTSLNNIMTILRGALKVIQGVLDVFIGVFTGDWKRAWDGIKGIVSGVLEIIKGLVSQAFNVIRTAGSTLFTALGAVFTAGWNAIKAGTTAGLSALVAFMSGLPGRARDALGSLDNVLSAVASAAWGAFRSAMAQKISEAVQLAGSVDNRIRGALGNLGGLLFSAGRDIISGLIGGIRSMIGEAAAAAANAAKAVANAAKNALGINSPSRVFEGIGKNVGEGMIVGMDGTRRAVTAAASSLLDRADVAGMNVGGAGYVNSRLAATSGAAPIEKAVSYNVTINGTLDPTLTPDSIIDALRRMELLAPRG